MSLSAGSNALTVRRLGLAALGFGISATAVWLCIRSIDLAEVWLLLQQAQLLLIAAFVLVLAAQTLVRARRWSILLPYRDGQRIATRRVLPPLLIGYLGNTILPARLGEPTRAVVLARREKLVTASVFGSVVLERVVDAATLAVIVLPAAQHAGAPQWIIRGAAIVAAAAVVVLAVLSLAGMGSVIGAIRCAPERVALGRARGFATVVAARLEEFAVGIGAFGRRPAVLFAGLMSVIAWVMDATLMWLTAASLGVPLEPAEAVLIAGVTVLVTVIPAGPGYIGTYELAATTTAVALGIPAESALAVAILAHALTLLSIAIAGTIALIVVQRDWARDGSGASGPAPAVDAPSPVEATA